MIKENNNHYNAIVTAQNKVGVLARITIMLRKFNVNIHSIDVDILEENNFYNIHLLLDTSKTPQEFNLVMKKLERLVPVVKVKYEAVSI